MGNYTMKTTKEMCVVLGLLAATGLCSCGSEGAPGAANVNEETATVKSSLGAPTNPATVWNFPSPRITCTVEYDTGSCSPPAVTVPACADPNGVCVRVGNMLSCSYVPYATAQNQTCTCFQGQVHACYTPSRNLGIQTCVQSGTSWNWSNTCTAVE